MEAGWPWGNSQGGDTYTVTANNSNTEQLPISFSTTNYKVVGAGIGSGTTGVAFLANPVDKSYFNFGAVYATTGAYQTNATIHYLAVGV